LQKITACYPVASCDRTVGSKFQHGSASLDMVLRGTLDGDYIQKIHRPKQLFLVGNSPNLVAMTSASSHGGYTGQQDAAIFGY
jgi:hypothetical protein